MVVEKKRQLKPGPAGKTARAGARYSVNGARIQ